MGIAHNELFFSSFEIEWWPLAVFVCQVPNPSHLWVPLTALSVGLMYWTFIELIAESPSPGGSIICNFSWSVESFTILAKNLPWNSGLSSGTLFITSSVAFLILFTKVSSGDVWDMSPPNFFPLVITYTPLPAAPSYITDFTL